MAERNGEFIKSKYVKDKINNNKVKLIYKITMKLTFISELRTKSLTHFLCVRLKLQQEKKRNN